MDESQPISPRARLQQLLAIPERHRTDAEWDGAQMQLEIKFHILIIAWPLIPCRSKTGSPTS